MLFLYIPTIYTAQKIHCSFFSLNLYETRTQKTQTIEKVTQQFIKATSTPQIGLVMKKNKQEKVGPSISFIP